MTNPNQLIELLTKKYKGQENSVVVNIRITNEENAKLQEIADHLGISRQEIIHTLITDFALPNWEMLHHQKVPDDMGVDDETKEIKNNKETYFLLNTNKAHNYRDHEYMLSKQRAAAFEPGYMEKINKIKKDDIVFLYESGNGIVAYGVADGQPMNDTHNGIADRTRYQTLLNFTKLTKPLSAREIKLILEREIPFAQTMIRVPNGKVLLEEIKKREQNSK